LFFGAYKLPPGNLLCHLIKIDLAEFKLFGAVVESTKQQITFNIQKSIFKDQIVCDFGH